MPDTAHKGAILYVSLGCPKNLVDTEILAGHLATEGYSLTTAEDSADIMLINTCSFLREARAEASDEITNALLWKANGKGRKVVVAGCWPQLDSAYIKQAFPDVDLIIGVNDIPKVVKRLEEVSENATAASAITKATYLQAQKTPRLKLTPTSYAYIKIADGCEHGCRFCLIPKIRGAFRSRPAADIINECKALLKQGTKELILVAQDTTYYGHDLHDGTSLVSLLKEIDQLAGDFWVRVMYTHPAHVTDDFIDLLGDENHILPYIDIPLQHISDRILSAMGRRISSETTYTLLKAFRERVPDACLRTSFIVGYPGETEEDFQELADLVKTYRFERLGVFAFSPEPGTTAAKQATENDSIPETVIMQRQAHLLELQQQIALENNEALLNQKEQVLIDGLYDEETLCARTYRDAPEIDNLVFIPLLNSNVKPDFKTAKFRGAEPYDLFAEIPQSSGKPKRSKSKK